MLSHRSSQDRIHPGVKIVVKSAVTSRKMTSFCPCGIDVTDHEPPLQHRIRIQPGSKQPPLGGRAVPGEDGIGVIGL